jgi:hypothetical protein
MEYIIENTNIFDYDLKSKISSVISAQLSGLDRKFTHRIDLSFDKLLLNDRRVDEFIIPDEYLPKYLVGKILDREEKISQILSYQIKLVEEILEENNIQVYSAGIKGRILESVDIIRVEIIKDKEVEKKISKRNRPIKVHMIMPNEEATFQRMYDFAEKYYNEMILKLSMIVGSKKELDKILKNISIYDAIKIYYEFNKMYGEYWSTSKAPRRDLKEEFIERLKLGVGDETMPIEMKTEKQIREPINRIIYEVPIYSMPKEKFEMKWETIKQNEKNEMMEHRHPEENIRQIFSTLHYPKYIWRYNQIIGYICISISGSDILFNVYKTLDKNIHVNSKTKHFMQDMGLNNAHFRVSDKDSNKTIKDKITEKLDEIEKEYNPRGYYIDLETYRNTIEHMNIKALFK